MNPGTNSLDVTLMAFGAETMSLAINIHLCVSLVHKVLKIYT
jgi:hypothetical protein